MSTNTSSLMRTSANFAQIEPTPSYGQSTAVLQDVQMGFLCSMSIQDLNLVEVRGRRASRRNYLMQGSTACQRLASLRTPLTALFCACCERPQVHNEIPKTTVYVLNMTRPRGASSASLEPPKMSIEDPGARDLGLWKPAHPV